MKNKKFYLFLIGVIICIALVLMVTKFLKKEESLGDLEITPRRRNDRRARKTDNDFFILYKY